MHCQVQSYIDDTGFICMLMECLGTQTLGIGKVTWEGFLTLLGLQLFHTYSRDKTHEKIAGVAFHIDSPCGLCVPIFFQQQTSHHLVANPFVCSWVLHWNGFKQKKRYRPKPKSFNMFKT